MSGSFLRSGGRRAHGLLLHHFRPLPLRRELSKPSSTPNRSYVRSHLLSSKFKESSSSSRISPDSPSLYSHSLSSANTATAAATAAAAAAASSSPIRAGFVTWYLGMIETRPVLTKSLTASAIFAAADVVSQAITVSPSDSFDFLRTLRMTGYGMILSGPSLHFWFNFVSRVLPKTDIPTTFKKMGLGQVIYGPIMTSVFFSTNAGLQGETGGEIFARLQRDLIPTLMSGVAYWPMCDFITFKFVPVRLQPLVSNSFSFLWTIYLTYMASLEKANPKKISTD